MKVCTTRFGPIEVPEDRVIRVPEGILGFPEEHRYVVLDHDAEAAPFKWLQAVDRPDLAFIVVDPRLILPDYRLDLDEETRDLLGRPHTEDVVPMAIVHIPKDDPVRMTANLRAPILVGLPQRVGRQVVLLEDVYALTHPLFPPESSRAVAAF